VTTGEVVYGQLMTGELQLVMLNAGESRVTYRLVHRMRW
jgi:hypothetical protein